jgi:hypothetical protein
LEKCVKLTGFLTDIVVPWIHIRGVIREVYDMAEKPAGHILIECPNTIFHLYARDEGELSKIETFLRNIRGIKRLGLNDIYIWCNRQGILYVTKFHYRKDFSLWFNMKSYYLYFLQKFRYQFAQYAG